MLLALVASSCATRLTTREAATPAPASSTTIAGVDTTPVPPTEVTPTATAAPAVVAVPYRLERGSFDPATASFEPVVRATLADAKGWRQGGFDIHEDPEASFVVVLAEPADAQRLCLPMDVYSKYSCQNGVLVVLNADRWRAGTPEWTGDLASYRQMLVNHEFGHLLGQRHVPCGPAGAVAPVMCQQSTELRGALPNPWPTAAEIATAAAHDRALAPLPGE